MWKLGCRDHEIYEFLIIDCSCMCMRKAQWIVRPIPGKPEDWPQCNLREAKVSRVWQRICQYYKNPNPTSRDLMLREAFCWERGDLPSKGNQYRISPYEAKMLARIYRAGHCFNSCTLRMFVYHVVMEWVDDDKYYERSNKNLSFQDMVVTESRKRKVFLPWQVQLFYDAYSEYCEDWAKRRFGVILEKTFKRVLGQKHSKEELYAIEHTIVGLLYDISCNLSTERDVCFDMTRNEIRQLIKVEAELFHKRRLSIMRRPLKGTLMIQLSNLILKSRPNGVPRCVYKYISNGNLSAAHKNKQIWLSDVRDLNDKYEGAVAQEAIAELQCNCPAWVNKLSFNCHKRFYVGCYSKTSETAELDSRYGECVLGYYGDRLVDYLGPIYWHREQWKTPSGIVEEDYPMFSQISVLDVIYNKSIAKEELKFLISCIDELGITDGQKRRFLGEILQYWKLSFKDSVSRDNPSIVWERERERRYIIHYYKGYDYRGSYVDEMDRKLKFETTVVFAPDFLAGKVSKANKRNVQTKLKKRYAYTTMPDYYVCRNCFAKGVFPDGFVGYCKECGFRSVVPMKSTTFKYVANCNPSGVGSP